MKFQPRYIGGIFLFCLITQAIMNVAGCSCGPSEPPKVVPIKTVTIDGNIYNIYVGSDSCRYYQIHTSSGYDVYLHYPQCPRHTRHTSDTTISIDYVRTYTNE